MRFYEKGLEGMEQRTPYQDAFEQRYFLIMQWVYSAQINLSGLFADVEKSTVPYDRQETRSVSESVGFLFPAQMALLMQGETEDVVAAFEPVLLPIFGPVMALRYPSAPLYVVANRRRVSIVSFVNTEVTSPKTLFELLGTTWAIRPPTAVTTLKSQFETTLQYNRAIRYRARKKLPLVPDLHPVNWCRAPMEKNHELHLFNRTSRSDQGDMQYALSGAIRSMGGVLNGEYTADVSYMKHKYDDQSVALQRAIPKYYPFFALSRILNLAEPREVMKEAYEKFDKVAETLTGQEVPPSNYRGYLAQKRPIRHEFTLGSTCPR